MGRHGSMKQRRRNSCWSSSPRKFEGSLVIEDMRSWLVVDGEFSGFPSLNSLAIKDILNLRSWELFNGCRFPRLSILEIDDCPVLNNLPSLLDTSSLHRLGINQCPEISSLPDDGLPLSHEAFIISDCDIIKERCRLDQFQRLRLTIWRSIRI
ncbi:hypothetical protein ACS0TY_025190 [Phlomoides rotata]